MKYLFNYFTFACLFFIASIGFSQDISNYNLYTINQYAINPAYVGSKEGVFTTLHFRKYFSGVSNAPRNLMFVVHSPIGNKLGLGGNIMVEEGGLFKSTSANIAASYKINIATDHLLTVGLSGGLIKRNLDMNKLQGADMSDPTLMNNYNDKVLYKFGAGLKYNWKKLEVSLAVPSIKQDDSQLFNYFLGYASYQLQTADEQWRIRPSVLYKGIGTSPDQLDVNVNVEWRKLLWLQAGYRSNNNFIIGGGVTIENLNLGYAYETPTGKVKGLSKGAHEIVLTYLIKPKSKKVPEAALDEEATAVPVPVHNEVQDSMMIRIKELETEMSRLRHEVGEIAHYVAMDSVRHSNDTIYKYAPNGKHIKLAKGNYVIFQTSRTRDFATKLAKMYASKKIETYITYNETQTLFYVVGKEFDDYERARKEMEEFKRKGHKSAWVLIY
ncbi:MAG: PorP/SprF family type IX secretion system membrane protein [Cytophagaceae bacterium]|nr:PorP/SprF family type IX secretion system membrane protein [Cytophagaceae bacterium]